jgi:hypothetical protein
MGGGNTAMSGMGGMGGGSAMGANAAAQQSFMQMQLMQQQNMMALQQMMMQVNMPSGMGGMGHYPGSVMSGHPSMMQGGPMGVCFSRLPDIVACVTSLGKLQNAM